MKINNLDDIKNFLKEYNGKKIFIISGRKSYKLSTAEKKNLKIYFINITCFIILK